MSVLTRKRLLVTLFASIAVSTTLFASNPSPRTQVRMAWDPSSGSTVLFGGLSPFDHATQSYHEIAETWVFGSSRWIQLFPATSPSARAGHMMTTDTKRSRVLLFGGVRGTTDLNDLWVWQNGNWSEVQSQSTPTARNLAGFAYDRARDRAILFGGTRYSDDKKTVENLYDTWEFDGTNWQQRSTSGPSVIRPILGYDALRNQTILLGVNDKSETLMYSYNPADASWTQLKPEYLPICVNSGAMSFLDYAGVLFLAGGACAVTTDVAHTWDGTRWVPVDTETEIDQIFGQAMSYDMNRGTLLMYGGTSSGGTPQATTYTFANSSWSLTTEATRPQPRSLAAFVSDPVSKSIWMFGGLEQNEGGYLDDFWQYQNGQWYRLATDPAPGTCGAPLAAFDSDRNKIVLNCAGDTMWEFDVTTSTWATFTNLKEKPSTRRFAHMVYDPQQKKTVFFGGLETYDYQNDTWLWDGTQWTQVKKNKADARALGSMWYDTSLKKVVVYGGIGRPRPEDTVRRYSDMWSFDPSNGWTKMSVTATPGERYGAMTTVDPRSGKTLLFGGLRIDEVEKIKKQVYANDLWEWNGTAWTKLSPTTPPPVRENGMFAFDPASNRMVIFGGFAGFYKSDIWTSSDLLKWEPVTDSVARRRVVRR